MEYPAGKQMIELPKTKACWHCHAVLQMSDLYCKACGSEQTFK